MTSFGELCDSTRFGAYYHLNNDYFDYSGNSRTLTNSSSTFGPGKCGSNAISCASASSQYAYRDLEDMGIKSNVITMSVWFAPASTPSGVVFVIMDYYYNTANKRDYRLTYDGNIHGPIVSALDSVGWKQPYLVKTLDLNSWHHWCLTIDGADLFSAYFDGNLIATPTTLSGGTIYCENYRFTLGANCNWNTAGRQNYANGRIDEVILENRAWSATEVRHYYEYSKGRRPPTTGV